MEIKNMLGNSKVVIMKICESDVNAMLTNIDLNDNGSLEYVYDDFVDIVSENVPEYAFAFHENDDLLTIKKIRESAKSIMKIKDINDLYKLMSDNIPEEQWPDEILKKYNDKGFFGEIILHFLLKEFYQTIPLISKIYFKDSFSTNAHGFDAVHVDNDFLWLGETKFYSRKNNRAGEDGIVDLIDDLKKHFNKDYLNEQFIIIKRGVQNSYHPFRDKALKDIQEMKFLSQKYKGIKIPLLCLYQSETVKEEFIGDIDFDLKYSNEINKLKEFFINNNDHINKSKLKIVLILFPVDSKKKIVFKILQKLIHLQNI